MHVICTAQTFCIFLLRNNLKRDNEQNDFIVNCLALEKNEDKRLAHKVNNILRSCGQGHIAIP